MKSEKDIVEYYGKEVASLKEVKIEYLVNKAFRFWKTRGFPFREFSDSEIGEDLLKLQSYNKSRLRRTLQKPSVVGLALATSFHPQIWQAKVRGKSPLEVFNDDVTFRKVLIKAYRMFADRKCWNASCIRMVVGLQNRSRVANFRPTVARAISDFLSKDGDHILDFCAGYGGRYLGIATLSRSYFGIDVSTEQIDGLKKMSSRLKQFVNSHASFVNDRAEIALKKIKSASYDLIFTSPPYFRLEKYEDNPFQSGVNYADYESWKSGFLEIVFCESVRIVKRGGYIVINLSNYGKYMLEEDFLELCKRYVPHKVRILKMSMSTNPSFKKRTGIYKKYEPIFVLKK